MHTTNPKSISEKLRFSIISSTVLFIEGPDVSSGANKRALFDKNLRSKYGVDFSSMKKRFTIVANEEASIARIESSSVSSRVHARDEKCMRCYVLVLQNCMKLAFSLCADDSSLQKIEFDFRTVK